MTLRKENEDFRADLRAGIVASTIANVNSTGKIWKPAEFMPFAEHEEQVAQSPEEVSSLMRGIAGALKGGG